jgi:hypothetical protein
MANFIPSTNIYSNLDSPQSNEDNSTSCPLRKAKKKMREIEKLKQKQNKTPQEYAKIREEPIWRAIVEPVYTGNEPSEKELLQKRIKRHYKKQIVELEKKLKAEKEKHKKEMDFMKKQFQEQDNYKTSKIRALERENELLKTQQKERPKQKSNFDFRATEISFEEKIVEEFDELTRTLGSQKKAYRSMIINYHPDKCKQKDISDKAIYILNALKDNYEF